MPFSCWPSASCSGVPAWSGRRWPYDRATKPDLRDRQRVATRRQLGEIERAGVVGQQAAAAGHFCGRDEHARAFDRAAVVGREHASGDATAGRRRLFLLRGRIAGRLLARLLAGTLTAPAARTTAAASVATRRGNREGADHHALLDRKTVRWVDCHDFFTARPTQSSSSRSQHTQVPPNAARTSSLSSDWMPLRISDAAGRTGREQRAGGSDEQRAGQVGRDHVGRGSVAGREVDDLEVHTAGIGVQLRGSRAPTGLRLRRSRCRARAPRPGGSRLSPGRPSRCRRRALRNPSRRASAAPRDTAASSRDGPCRSPSTEMR